MKIACLQMCSTTDLQSNLSKACDYIRKAAAAGAELIVLPEFFNTIYFAQYRDSNCFDLAETDSGATISAMREVAQRNSIAVVSTIYEKVKAGLYFDTAFLIDKQGEIVFKYRKVHPAAVKSLEKLYFRYGSRFETYKFGGWQLGIGICYDMDFPETARCLTIAGAELLLAPYATSRITVFQELLQTRAFENGCFLVAANKVGREGDWNLGGGSAIIGPDGTILQSADRESDALLLAEIDRTNVDIARIGYPFWRDRRPDLYGSMTKESDADL